MRRALLLLAIGALAFVSACDVNDYCLNCATGDGGGGDDGGSPDAIRDGGGQPDACIVNGVEVCDGLDNDCNGTADDNIPTVGDACGADVGVCTTGVMECNGAGVVCSGDALQGPEECDDLDNDCDGTVDNGNPEGGARCGTDIGDCIAGFTQCITGGVLDCVGDSGTVGGQPELCDGRDNDCDGNFDESLPSMGSCGATEDGDCEFGELMCVGGGPQCVGYIGPTFEECDVAVPPAMAHDSDCDGMDHNGYDLDHDVRNCGACGASCVGTIDNATAACNLACVGGTNDGRACTSTANCPGGVCGGGDCVVGNCDVGYWDNAAGGPGDPNEGCEYGPCTFEGPQEDCNFRDDNCNGQVDEALTPPSMCLTTGACAAVTASCFHDAVAIPATSYWECDYSTGDVSIDPSGNIIQESQCDGVDNDCDGRIDEGDAQVFNRTSCADSGFGVCQKVGHFVCDPADQDAAPICSLNLAVPIVDSGGAAPVAESCDGKDNDCDSLVDDNTLTITTVARSGGVSTVTTSTNHTFIVGTTVIVSGVTPAPFNGTFAVTAVTATTFSYAQGALPAVGSTASGGNASATNSASRGALQTWVPIGGGVSIMAYEASRPDASNPDPSAISPPLTVNISAITRASNVVTVTTSAAHNLVVGQSAVIAGVTNATFNGTFTVTAVTSPTVFRYAQTAANASSSGGTATRPVPAGFPLGLVTTYPCSKAGVEPWVNVKQPDAETACAAIGGRLCSEQEWHRGCAAVTGRTYPVVEPGTSTITTVARVSNVVTVTTAAAHGFNVGDSVVIAGVLVAAFNGTFAITSVPSATTFTYAQVAANANSTGGTATVATSGKIVFEAEDYASLVANTTLAASEFPAGQPGRAHTWVPDYTSGYSGISALRASPNNSDAMVANTGANVATAQAAAESPRLVFPVTIATTGNHYVWVRMWSPSANNNNDNEIHVAITATPGSGSPQATLATTVTNAWQWRQTAAINIAAVGTTNVVIYMKEDGARIDEIVLTQSSSATAPTNTTLNGNDWTFGDVYAANTCNGKDFDGDVPPSDLGDQDDVIATGAQALCFAEWGAQDVFDMSGNVKEWTNERFPASNPLRGGASNNAQQGITCSNAFSLADDSFFFNNVGFRCCK